MRIHRIFHRPRVENPSGRGRRSLATLVHQWELLETRTPLSSGLQLAVDMPAVSPPVEIGLFIARQPPRIDLTSLGAISSDRATAAVQSEIWSSNPLPSARTGPVLVALTAAETFASIAPVGNVVSAVETTAGSDGIAVPEPVRSGAPLDAGGETTEQLPTGEPPITTGPMTDHEQAGAGDSGARTDDEITGPSYPLGPVFAVPMGPVPSRSWRPDDQR